MATDEGLVQRLRELLEDDARVSEKRMFGGIAFLVNGSMALGTLGDELMVRVGREAHAAAVSRPHAREMAFTGRPMRGFVQVAPEGFAEDEDLRAWVAQAVAYAATVEKKPKTARAAARPKRPPAPRERQRRER